MSVDCVFDCWTALRTSPTLTQWRMKIASCFQWNKLKSLFSVFCWSKFWIKCPAPWQLCYHVFILNHRRWYCFQNVTKYFKNLVLICIQIIAKRCRKCLREMKIYKRESDKLTDKYLKMKNGNACMLLCAFSKFSVYLYQQVFIIFFVINI